MKNKIYWAYWEGAAVDLVNEPISFEKPSKIKDLKDEHKEIMYCPSVRDFYSTLIPIKSCVNFQIKDRQILPDGNDSVLHKAHMDNICYQQDHNLFFSQSKIIFFAENDASVFVLPPLSQKNDFSQKARVICGEMNISKWFRPVHPAFILDEGVDVKISRGDVIAHVKVVSETPVELHQFEWTDKLRTICQKVDAVKSFNTGFLSSITNYYEAFRRWGYREKILKEIRLQMR